MPLRLSKLLKSRPNSPGVDSTVREYEERFASAGSGVSEVSAVNVPPTWTAPVIVGIPVAAELGREATDDIAALVSVSAYPSSSVKLTVTLTVLP